MFKGKFSFSLFLRQDKDSKIRFFNSFHKGNCTILMHRTIKLDRTKICRMYFSTFRRKTRQNVCPAQNHLCSFLFLWEWNLNIMPLFLFVFIECVFWTECFRIEQLAYGSLTICAMYGFRRIELDICWNTFFLLNTYNSIDWQCFDR